MEGCELTVNNMQITQDELDVFNNAPMTIHKAEYENIDKITFKNINELNSKIQSFSDSELRTTIITIIRTIADYIIANNYDYKVGIHNGTGRRPSDILAKLRLYMHSFNPNDKWHSYMMTSRNLMLYLLGWDRIRFFTIKDFSVDDFIFLVTEFDSLKPKPLKPKNIKNAPNSKYGNLINQLNDLSIDNRLYIGIPAEYIMSRLHTQYNWSNDDIHDLIADSYTDNNPDAKYVSSVKSHIIEQSDTPEEFLYLHRHMSKHPLECLMYEPIMKILTENKYLFAKMLTINAEDMDTLIMSNEDSQCDYLDFLLLSAGMNASEEIRNYEFSSSFNLINDNMFTGFMMNALRNCTSESQYALAIKMVDIIRETPGFSDYNEYDDNNEATRREHAGIMRTLRNGGFARAIRDYPVEYVNECLCANIDYTGLKLIDY